MTYDEWVMLESFDVWIDCVMKLEKEQRLQELKDAIEIIHGIIDKENGTVSDYD